MKTLLPLLALALAAPAAARAQAVDWARAPHVRVTMTGDGYRPRLVELPRGRPVVLDLFNRSDKGHNLTQEAFFRDARVVSPAGRTRGGKVSMDGHEVLSIRLIAPRGRPGARYQFSSTVLGDAADGYKGEFVLR